MSYKIEDVFSPRSFPQNTYITRKLDDEETVDEQLKQALSMKGNLIFVSGASKSGKTVLCHRVIDNNKYIDLSGTQINSKEDFWNHIAEQLPLSDTVVKTSSVQRGNNVDTGVSAGVNFGVLSVNLNGKNKDNTISNNQITVTNVRTERQIIKYIIDNNKVLVIDDFHYVNADVKMYIARTLKTELFNGLKAVIISLPHRSDEAIVCNPDLIGRTTSIEIPPWRKDELKEIAVKGFTLLDMQISDDMVSLLARESITSPQLMQDNCFQLAFAAVKKSKAIDEELVQYAFRRTAKNYSHYERIAKSIGIGPVQGFGRRKKYTLANGTADIYQLILLALKADPPVTELNIFELKNRIKLLLKNNSTLSSVVLASAITKIIAIVKDNMPDLDALEYQNQCLYILDPFLLFYLRWKN